MSGIVLSASVRQNLLSLQSTSQLLATTQNDLATGNKVNSALDNPTNYFTAQSLNSRASDISSLLDGIGNGVQVLQAANTGITSLQSLISSAKSIATQALQASSGYSTKSQFSATITGATADNLLGTTPAGTDASFVGTATNGVTAAVAPSSGTETGTALTGVTGSGATVGTGGDLDLSGLDGDSITVGSTTITFDASATATSGAGTNAVTIGVGASSNSTLGDILGAITTAAGGGASSSVDATTGAITLTSGTAADIAFTGADKAAVLTALGLPTTDVTHNAGSAAGTSALAATTLLSGTATSSANAVSSAFTAGQTLTVNGKTITFASTGTTSTSAAGGTINLTTGTTQDVLDAIDKVTGNFGTANASTIDGTGKVTIHTGTASDLAISSTNTAALGALGLGTGVTTALTPATTGLSGKELTIGATGDGTATDITFGTATGQISTLNELNTALAANNLQASIDTSGKLTITTSNNSASETIGDVEGSATDTGNNFAAAAGVQTDPVVDADSQATRANLVNQYNTVIDQIKTTAQDSSFNGVNLLNGDLLQLTFNETGSSTLNIQGNTDDPGGLGLSSLTAGTDFLDNDSTNKIIQSLTNASSTLSSQASALGSNLSIVQIRQTFSTGLINVLQTGASNLTLADPNEEAADSQALSTRQSIAVSALALANQSQQSVLQLLQG